MYVNCHNYLLTSLCFVYSLYTKIKHNNKSFQVDFDLPTGNGMQFSYVRINLSPQSYIEDKWYIKHDTWLLTTIITALMWYICTYVTYTHKQTHIHTHKHVQRLMVYTYKYICHNLEHVCNVTITLFEGRSKKLHYVYVI